MVDAVILAGGRNSRIQTRKALLAVSGRPIVERIVATLRPLVGQILLVTNEPELYGHLNLPTTGDLIPGGGPLSGVHAGFSLSQADQILVVACDMPFLNPTVVAHLLAEAACHQEVTAVVPHWDAGLEPLHSVYSRSCLPLLEERLRHGQLRLSAFLTESPVFRVELDEWAAERGIDLKTAFMNVNTWPEWEVAEKLAGLGGGGSR